MDILKFHPEMNMINRNTKAVGILDKSLSKGKHEVYLIKNKNIKCSIPI